MKTIKHAQINKSRECTASRPALQEILIEILQAEIRITVITVIEKKQDIGRNDYVSVKYSRNAHFFLTNLKSTV